MDKRIVYQLVAPLHLTAGTAEVERREAFLRSHAADGIDVEVRPTKQGMPPSRAIPTLSLLARKF